MKLYNEPTIEVLVYSTEDIIQSSVMGPLDGNDPYLPELEGWVRTDI